MCSLQNGQVQYVMSKTATCHRPLISSTCTASGPATRTRTAAPCPAPRTTFPSTSSLPSSSSRLMSTGPAYTAARPSSSATSGQNTAPAGTPSWGTPIGWTLTSSLLSSAPVYRADPAPKPTSNWLSRSLKSTTTSTSSRLAGFTPTRPSSTASKRLPMQ